MYERTHAEMLVGFNKSRFRLKYLLLLLTVTPTLIEKEKKKVTFLCMWPCLCHAGTVPSLVFVFKTSTQQKSEKPFRWVRVDSPGGMLAGMKCHPHNCHKAALGNGLARASAGIR